MPPLTTASISLELLQDCLGTLEQLSTGITNLGVDATEDPDPGTSGQCPAGGTADVPPAVRERPWVLPA